MSKYPVIYRLIFYKIMQLNDKCTIDPTLCKSGILKLE